MRMRLTMVCMTLCVALGCCGALAPQALAHASDEVGGSTQIWLSRSVENDADGPDDEATQLRESRVLDKRLAQTSDGTFGGWAVLGMSLGIIVTGILARHRHGSRWNLACVGAASVVLVSSCVAAGLCSPSSVLAQVANVAEADSSVDEGSLLVLPNPPEEPSVATPRALTGTESLSYGHSSSSETVEPSAFTILLDPNGANEDTVTVPVLSNAFVVPENPFTYERHAFLGWSLDADGEGITYAPGTDVRLSEGDVLYAQWNLVMPSGVEDMDFGSCRLIVGMNDAPPCGTVLSSCDGVWLLGFSEPAQAAWAYVDLLEKADFVAPDQVVGIAQQGELVLSEGPEADLSVLDEAEPVWEDAVALVDTGVTGHSGNVVDRISVIGATVIDNNGHGTHMAEVMEGVDGNVRIVSIKAADEWGEASAASVYVAVQQAIRMRAKVVNLSLCALATEGNAAIEQAIHDAHDAGVMVVGAAGNYGCDACHFVPGKVDEAVIVGSCNSEGSRNPSSNFGTTVDLYVPSASTSSAAAKVSAWLRARGTFGEEEHALFCDEARQALGFVQEYVQEHAQDGQPDDSGSQEQPDAEVPTVAGTAYLQLRVGWRNHAISSRSWTNSTSEDSGDADLDQLTDLNVRLVNTTGLQGNVYYEGWISAYAGTTGEKTDAPGGSMDCSSGSQYRCLEDVRMWLSGDMGKCYDISYSCLMSNGLEYDPNNLPNAYLGRDCLEYPGKTLKGSNGEWTHVYNHSTFIWRYKDKNGKWTYYKYGYRGEAATAITGVRKISTSITLKEHMHRVMVRYQQADGSWGEYEEARTGEYKYGDSVPSWSRAADAAYERASMAGYVAGLDDQDNYVSVYRKTHTVHVRCLNPSGNAFDAGEGDSPVVFDLGTNGGEWLCDRSTEPIDFTVCHGQTVTIQNIRTNEEYELDEVVGAVSNDDGCFNAVVESDTTITIRTRNAVSLCNVSFQPNLDGTTGEVPGFELESGQTCVLPNETFAHALYDFVAWNTQADGTGTWYSPGQEVDDLASEGVDEVVLFAQWNEKQLRVVAPVAMTFVAQDDGVLVAPANGLVAVRNAGQTVVCVTEARLEAYDGTGLELGFRMDREQVEPGGEACVVDVHGRVNDVSLMPREVGCIHWQFDVVA